MELINWDPFADMRALRDNINRLFEERLAESGRGRPFPEQPWAPLVDIYETDAAIVVAAELPGVNKDDLRIELTADGFTLKGERKLDAGRSYLRRERAHGPFQRSFTLRVPVDQAKVKAKYADGVLEITLPMAREAGPRRVKVEVE
jgi:HSP20 family protein